MSRAPEWEISFCAMLAILLSAATPACSPEPTPEPTPEPAVSFLYEMTCGATVVRAVSKDTSNAWLNKAPHRLLLRDGPGWNVVTAEGAECVLVRYERAIQ